MMNDILEKTQMHAQCSRILSTLRFRENVNRQDVKAHTGYTMTAVINALGALVEQGLVAEERASARLGGKHGRLSIRPEGAYAIGLEFNFQQLSCVVVNLAYEVEFTATEPVDWHDTEKALLEKIRTTIRLAFAHLGEAAARVVGIGFGLPGYVDRVNGVGLEYAYLRNWRNVPVRRVAGEEFGCRVLVENHINALAVAYRWRNFREITEDFVFLSMKHGVGMGAYLDNRLYTGSGHAGRIGHVRLTGGTRPCACGQVGCLDAEASFVAIRQKLLDGMEQGRFGDIRALTGGDPEALTVQMLLDSATAGQADAVTLLREAAGHIGQSLAMVVGALNPRRIVIGNGLGFRPFSDAVREVLREMAPQVLLKGLVVESIVMPDNMGALGAAMLIMEERFHSREEIV